MDAEAKRRAQYQTTAEYQKAQHSNFNEAPPEVLATSPSSGSATKGSEVVIRKDGKPVVGITFPPDWKQKVGENQVSAVSADGHAWTAIATREGVKDQEAGIETIKKGFAKYLKDTKYDEPTKTKGGALVVTGTGKGMKSGINVVFAAGVFDSGAGPLAGAAFVIDENVEDHYKDTVRFICQTIKRAKDIAK
ncbi:MAG: hypothetical protein L0Y72_05045 [Gemmataceae bacterium]|nr:hypothetical protein [Gemmataceae bacterium]MCI0738389.1 hypothetical protein [Gemmataceae bacterium]